MWGFLLLLCERSAKRDMGHILLPNSRLAAYGGVMLQRFEV